MICYCSKILIMLIPPIVPEDGVLWRFPVWSLAECYHCGTQEEHLHTVGDSFRGRRRWQGRACHAHPLWDDGIQHAPGVTLWQILVGLQRVQHSGGPQSLHTARRFVLRCSKLHTSRRLRKLKGEREGEYFSVFVKHFPWQGWAVSDFLVQEWSTTCWPIQWKNSSTPQHRATRSACSTISRTSSSVGTVMKENTREGSKLSFIISGEKAVKYWWVVTLQHDKDGLSLKDTGMLNSSAART